MKHLIALLALAIAATALAEEPEVTDQQRAAMKQATEFRTFTTTDGTTITGRPVDYRENTGVVELLTPNGSEEKFELSLFAYDDQAYIQDWYSVSSILLKRKLRITIDKETIDERKYGSDEWLLLPKLNMGKAWYGAGFSPDECNHIHYLLCLENKSGHELNGIHIEYCIYHKAEVKAELVTGRRDDITDSNVLEGGWITTDRKDLPDRTAIDVVQGIISIDRLANKERANFKTKLMVSPTAEKQEYFNSATEKIDREIDCEFLGIRYRVYLPTPNGNYAMMEFAEPKKLLKETEWPDK